MTDIRRYYIPGATIFLTAVTHRRVPHFSTPEGVRIYENALREVIQIYPFDLIAYVLLPDHLHWLIWLPDTVADFSQIMHVFKRQWQVQSSFHLWQRRFWDHIIRNEADFAAHFDYIHWNPVKHGYENKPEAYPHSSFIHWQNEGVYEPGWGWNDEPRRISGLKWE